MVHLGNVKPMDWFIAKTVAGCMHLYSREYHGWQTMCRERERERERERYARRSRDSPMCTLYWLFKSGVMMAEIRPSCEVAYFPHSTVYKREHCIRESISELRRR